ncbi:TrkA family potassium uptake protein [Parasulfuritortus cantonensis]|uniref:TrkA family potassium uptake protein n=1 Tax=Parasulfuritortus cantonensis TaxID=2528202 RepID=A0A4R1B1U0_9PROT|nr:NAD-binding protein [Parasulfuritortus cantonensis]TCJ11771.1 TrkA family potassium uptake protein [Parasulfuritortus cantonensis]
MTAGKLALFGCTTLGLEVARRLADLEQPFIMVDLDAERVQRARDEGFRVETLDFTDDEALRHLGLGEDIEGIFCLLPEDSENVFLAISARAMDAALRIVAICRQPEAASKLLAAGADKVVDPYAISGARAHDLIARPEVVELLEETVFGQQDLNIAEVTIPHGSWVHGVRLSELRRRMTQNVLLFGVVDAEHGSDLIFSTRNIDHNLDVGDTLVIIGARGQINAVRDMIRAREAPR